MYFQQNCGSDIIETKMNRDDNKVVCQYICNSREQLGSGLLCTVYQAKHNQTNLYVALKQISKVPKDNKGLNKEKIKECYQLEVEILNKCKLKNHKNVIKILDSFETDHHYYIVLELCEYNLKQYLESQCNKRLDQKDAVKILIQIVEGEKCLHELKYCHRDIKPENILIKDGCVKITDVNLAKQLDDINQEQTKTVVGTKFYLAPELNLGTYSPYKADIYSLGIVFYEMLYGLINKQQNHKICVEKSIEESEIKIDLDLKNLILNMVNPNPQKRADWLQVSSRLLEYTIKNNEDSESIKNISNFYINSSQEELIFYEQMQEEIEHLKKDDLNINILPSVLLIVKQIRGLLLDQLIVENDEEQDNKKYLKAKEEKMTLKQKVYQKETKQWYKKEIETKRQLLCQSPEIEDEFKYQEKNHKFELHLQSYLADLFNQLNNLNCESKNNEFKKRLLQLQLKLVIAINKNNGFLQVNKPLVESSPSLNQQALGFQYNIENPERLQDYINAIKPMIDQILRGK